MGAPLNLDTLHTVPVKTLREALLQLPDKEIQAIAYQSYAAFLALMAEELAPGVEYRFDEPVVQMVANLQDIGDGRLKRLITSIMPQFGKTVTNAIGFLPWCVLRNPQKTFAYGTFSADRAEEVGALMLNLMRTPMYLKLAPHVELDPRQQTKALFRTTAGGGIKCVGRGGPLTGSTVAGIVVDDAFKDFMEADSPTERQNVQRWYTGAVMTRIKNEPPDRPEMWDFIIHIGTRWHTDDLIGWVKQNQAHHDWRVLDFAALTEAGESFCPGRKSTAELLSKKQDVPAREWNALYMQRPTPAGGTIFNMEAFRRYSRATLPARFDRIVQSWDTAQKPAETNDPSVCTTWGIFGNKAYLLHVLAKRMGFPELKRCSRSHAEHWHADFPGADLVLVEDKSSGTSLVQELRHEGFPCPLRGLIPEGNKEMRALYMSDIVEQGHLYLPDQASWLADYEYELACFPVVKHDDQVDSTSQFGRWFQSNLRKASLLVRGGKRRRTSSGYTDDFQVRSR